MYYSRYFEGHVEETTASKIIYPLREGKGSSTTQDNVNTNQLKNAVVGNAIASTLRDCGLDARYVVDNGYIYFDYENSNIGIFIGPSHITYGYGSIVSTCGYGNTDYDYIYGVSDIGSGECSSSFNEAFSLTNNSSTGEYLKATDYRFCVTIIGDTSSMFSIYLGKYSSPTSLNASIGTFYFGKDKRDDSDVFGFYMSSSKTPIFLMSKDTLLPVDGEIMATSSSYAPASRLTLVDNNVVLIEQYFPTLPYIAMDNVFIDPGFNTSNKFYEIDGEIYMCSTPHFIKCTTPVIPTED